MLGFARKSTPKSRGAFDNDRVNHGGSENHHFGESSSTSPVQRSQAETAVCQLAKSRKGITDPRPKNGLDRMPSIDFSPDGVYATHVRNRSRMFFVCVLKARKFFIDKGIALDKTLFSDTAAAQVGSGMRSLPGVIDPVSGVMVPGSDSIDAAHRVNTTFNVAKAVSMGMPMLLAQDFEAMSSGTSQQFQKSNITADKVIDSIQTEYKNKILTDISTDTSHAYTKAIITAYLKKCESVLKEKQATLPMAKSDKNYLKYAAYRRAFLVIQEQLNDDSLAYEVQLELVDPP